LIPICFVWDYFLNWFCLTISLSLYWLLLFFALVRFFKLVENKASWLNPDLGFHGLRVLKIWPSLEDSPEFVWFFIFLYLSYFFLFHHSTFIQLEIEYYFFQLVFCQSFCWFWKLDDCLSFFFNYYSLLDFFD
jgi:hypothetical protein